MPAEENAVITRPVQRGELQLTAPEKATVAREPVEGQPAVPKEGIIGFGQPQNGIMFVDLCLYFLIVDFCGCLLMFVDLWACGFVNRMILGWPVNR